MVLRKWLICFPACLGPNNLISLVDLCGVDSLFPQGYLVLLVVVDWCHVLDDSQENWHCVFWKASSSVSVEESTMRTVKTRIRERLTGAMLHNQK